MKITISLHGANNAICLDRVSYETYHDQLVDTVQRLDSRLGPAYVDSCIQQCFGTRNFTAPLLDGKDIKVFVY